MMSDATYVRPHVLALLVACIVIKYQANASLTREIIISSKIHSPLNLLPLKNEKLPK